MVGPQLLYLGCPAMQVNDMDGHPISQHKTGTLQTGTELLQLHTLDWLEVFWLCSGKIWIHHQWLGPFYSTESFAVAHEAKNI